MKMRHKRLKLLCKIITRILEYQEKKKEGKRNSDIYEIFVTYISDENKQKNYKFLQTMNS